MKILNRYPLSSAPTSIQTPDGLLVVKPYQVVVWVRLQAVGRVSPVFPAFLDSGHNHNFSISTDQLNRWAGFDPGALRVVGRLRIGPTEMLLYDVDGLIHRNRRGTCQILPDPVALSLDRGISVAAEPLARLPILGIRGLMRRRLSLCFDGRSMTVSLTA